MNNVLRRISAWIIAAALTVTGCFMFGSLAVNADTAEGAVQQEQVVQESEDVHRFLLQDDFEDRQETEREEEIPRSCPRL